MFLSVQKVPIKSNFWSARVFNFHSARWRFCTKHVSEKLVLMNAVRRTFPCNSPFSPFLCDHPEPVKSTWNEPLQQPARRQRAPCRRAPPCSGYPLHHAAAAGSGGTRSLSRLLPLEGQGRCAGRGCVRSPPSARNIRNKTSKLMYFKALEQNLSQRVVYSIVLYP